MNNNKIFAVILEYDFFKTMSEERRLKMLAEKQVEWRVYISKEQREHLNEHEKQRLEGFVITDIQPVKVRMYDKKDLFPSEKPVLIDEKDLFPSEKPVLIDEKKQEKFYKKAERKRLKRSIPLKIGAVNTKKKGGR